MTKKTIPVSCKGAAVLPIDELQDFQGNLKILGKKEEEKLKKSLLRYGFTVPVFVRKNHILDGHQRIYVTKKLLESGYTIEGIPVVHINATDRHEAAEKLLQINSQYAKIDDQGLFDYMTEFNLDFKGLEDIELAIDRKEFDKKYFNMGFEFRRGKNSPRDKIKNWLSETDFFEMPEEEKVYLSNIKTVVLSFSGGADSTAALIWAHYTLRDRRIVCIFSDTGVEFPGITAHLADVVDSLGVDPEIVKPKKEWWTYLKQRGSWPSLIFRDCIANFIHEPINSRYMEFDPDTTLLIDGSRAEESTRGSQKTKKSPGSKKLRKFKWFHPCFDVKKDIINKIVEKSGLPLWKGYKQGFVRTACWCCPGQRKAQARALQENYPGLADEIRYWERILGPLRPFDQKNFDDICYGKDKGPTRSG